MKTALTLVGAFAGTAGTVDNTYDIVAGIVTENFKSHSGSIVEPVVKTVLSVLLWWGSLHVKSRIEKRRARKQTKKNTNPE